MASIACLGWGSLIWDPNGLPIQTKWHDDGPALLVEFARQSKDDRITLVIEPNALPVRALWAVMDSKLDLDASCEALRAREDCRPNAIACWLEGNTAPASIPTLTDWARACGIDAVIWTALKPKFKGEYRTPSENEVVEHLRSLTGAKRYNAEKYVRLAPRQIGTAYRRRIEAEFGWTALDMWSDERL